MARVMDHTYDCKHVVEIEQEPRHHLVFSNEFVRGFAVEIAPHDRSLCHHHPHDYLLYVASGAEIVSAARDEEPKKLSYRDGECELLEAGLVHVVDNRSDTPFRNVVVELLPRAGELGRGA
ncbi:MAG: cupin domain-containing protein, partial [Candidatus Korobacteraceae bacterium]